jgi:uncharacterized protein (TIGR03437 family)
MFRWKRAVGLAVVAGAAAVAAKEPLAECGSYFSKAREEVFLHLRQTVRRAGAARLAAGDTAAPRAVRPNQDVGEIAVIGAGGGVVGLRNPFDLVGQTVRFSPEAGGYRLETTSASYDAAAAQNGVRLELDDDDTERIRLPFAFRWYGASYAEAFVNSNGTVSFGAGELDYSGSFGRFAGGPPAIAGLFTDLDPSSSDGGVRLLREPGRVVISWDNVRLATDSFAAAGHTFQIRLYPDGRVELAYNRLGSTFQNGVVGVNPGGLRPVALVDLTAAPGLFPDGVAEYFTSASVPEVDLLAAAQRFYQTHEDAYDYLVFYNAMNVAAGPGLVAYEVTTRSSGEGYGDVPTDTGIYYGSKRRLQAVLNMGPTSQYPADPNGAVASRGAIGDTPLSLLAHEAGHLFLALVSVPSPTGSFFPPMLGAGLAHWAFPFHSDASVMEGNRIVDQGPGENPRFRTTATVEKYSALDQYLMGLRAPEEVPPTFAVLNSGVSNTRGPQVGVTFNGARLDITVEDVIRAAGRRTPDATVAQREFRMAFVVIVPEDAEPGSPAVAAAIAQVDGYRRAFEPYFTRATDGRARLVTTLRRSAQLTLWPAGGVTLGGAAVARLELESAVAEPLSFRVEAPLGIVGAPASVTIPAGARSVSFELTGNRPGAGELRLTPANAAYHAEVARLAVRPRSDLRVRVVSGDKQKALAGPLPEPVVIEVVDENRVPYSNQTVSVMAEGGGSVSPATAVTDAYGRASFQWTTAPGGFNLLRFQLPGGGSGLATALGTPAFAAGGVVNSASFRAPVAPGGFATIFGASLAGGAVAAASSANFPVTLGGVQVTVNGIPAPLSYVSDSQINFVVPGNISPGTAQLQVSSPLGASEAISVAVVAAAPGVFFDPLSGEGAVQIANTGRLTSQQPARAGDFLAIYGTGFGPAPAAAVTVGGVAAEVSYAGPTVIPGLQQVNARVPAEVGGGVRQLQLTVNGVQANPVSIFVAAGP